MKNFHFDKTNHFPNITKQSYWTQNNCWAHFSSDQNSIWMPVQWWMAWFLHCFCAIYGFLLAHYVLIKMVVICSEMKLCQKLNKRPTLYILSYICVYVHTNIAAWLLKWWKTPVFHWSLKAYISNMSGPILPKCIIFTYLYVFIFWSSQLQKIYWQWKDS